MIKRAMFAVAFAATLTGCGGGGSTALTMHGEVTALGGSAIGQPACSWGAMPAAVANGTVNVVSPSGSELAQVALAHPVATGKQLSGLPVCAMRFTTKGLPSERLYGVRIAGVSGTTWIHPSQVSRVIVFVGPQL
jgi:hypothetical protein